MKQPNPEASQQPSGQAHLQQAMNLSYRYLDRRERTVSDVRRHLEAKQLAAATIEQAIQALTELGSLDDLRYARIFAQDKRELEQWGTDRIEMNLLSRGVERDVIKAAFAEVPADTDTELERALAVLERRFPAAPGDRRERERALGLLLRKGYDSDTALEAIRSYAPAAAEC